MTSVVVFRHLAFEGLGLLGDLLADRGADVRHLDAGVDEIDAGVVAAADLLVVLGGPIGAGDEDRYPFLVPELAAIAARVRAGGPTLGVCLGAQLIARALGARVSPAGRSEIGYAPLTLTDRAEGSPLRHLAGVPVLHWHDDQFTLPEGAELLAATALTPHQAFTAGAHVLALQFHLETGQGDLERWLIGHAGALLAARIHPASLRRDAADVEPVLRDAAVRVFTEWLDAQPGCGGPRSPSTVPSRAVTAAADAPPG